MTTRLPRQEAGLSPTIVGVIASQGDLYRAARMRRPPDFFELRLDHLIYFLDKAEPILTNIAAPLIVTARGKREGGAHNLSTAKRRELLLRFLPHARFI